MPRLALLALCALAWLLTSCASHLSRPRSCAMILVIDGRQVIPSPGQFAAVEGKLKAQFEPQGLVLVPQVEGAEYISTIECRSQPGSPELTNLIVRHIGPNTFVRARPVHAPTIPADMPTLREVEREQQRTLTTP